MKKLSIVLLVIGLMNAGCSESSKEDEEVTPTFELETSDQIEDLDYEIYSLVIDDQFSSEKVVISQWSTSFIDASSDSNFYVYLNETVATFDTSLVTSVYAINEEPVLFDIKFISDDKELIVMPREQYEYLYEGIDSQNVNGFWEVFYKTFDSSNGIVTFSKISFNETSTKALFTIDRSYASLGAEASIIYLEKINGVWSIVKVVPTRIS